MMKCLENKNSNHVRIPVFQIIIITKLDIQLAKLPKATKFYPQNRNKEMNHNQIGNKQYKNEEEANITTLGATVVAALTTRPRKDLWLTSETPTGDPNLRFEGLRPSNDAKFLAEIDDAVS